MASTNKTTHYELSQYVGNDKPTYLTDYNNDMSNIDTGIYNAQTKADTAFANAGSADTKADNAQLTANQALNSAGSANTNIGTMANLETTDKTSLVGAINENVRNINNFNLTHFDTYDNTNMTTQKGSIASYSTITVAYNEDGSLAKIYGQIGITGVTTGGANDVSIQTALRPTSEINITGSLLAYCEENIYFSTITIKTTGEVVFKGNVHANKNNKYFSMNSLLFIKDFGDTPAPQN